MNRFPHRTSVYPRFFCIAVTALAMNLQAETVLVSRSSEGEQARDFSTFPSVSNDGRFIAFISKADNLVPGDTNGELDVFVHDRETRQTSRASVASDGSEANSGVGWTVKSISDDGRFVVFSSTSDNLVSGDDNRHQDIFLHDRESGETNRVSVTGNGAEANGSSTSPGIFGNGRYVTYHSSADNLVGDDTNDINDVFLHDRETGQTRRVNIASDGSEAERWDSDWSWIWWYTNPVSDDGRYVVFLSMAVRNTPEDDPEPSGLFLHDRETGETSRIPYGSAWAAFSNGGRYLAYDHYSWVEDPLSPRMPSGTYVLDQQTGETVRATVSYRGNPADNDSWHVAISGDGRSVAVASNATNLVPGDRNGTGDVFALDNPHFFRINAGLNDAWYDPETPGQGFQMTVFPLTKKMFVTWVTYDTVRPGKSTPHRLGGPGQRWLTAYGPYDGRTAVLDVSATTGGVFDSAEPATQSQSSGVMTVEFTTCTNASITYDLSSIGQQRVIPIQRISLENVPLCETLKEIE